MTFYIQVLFGLGDKFGDNFDNFLWYCKNKTLYDISYLSHSEAKPQVAKY